MVQGPPQATSVMIIIATVVTAMAGAVARAQQVPCYFSFGDTFFENGNNNDLVTGAKSNYPPYGIDFPNGPTGRFTNGRTIPDFLAGFLGFKDYIPPFAGSSPTQVFTGLNYASGASGILDDSGRNLGDNLSMNRQIGNHLEATTRAGVPEDRLKQCLYTISTGSSDYVNNYLMSPSLNSQLFTPDQFAEFLIQIYASQLKILYILGARKVALFGLPKLGCAPGLVAQQSGGGCNEDANSAVNLFNNKLIAYVNDVNKTLTDAKFTYVDVFNTGPSGLRNDSCCTVEPGQILCAANQPVCENRKEYAYFDAFHFTEVVYSAVAESAFTGQIASPYSIAELVGVSKPSMYE
ncbi:PREDICTED: GDSL esterase/lipase At4g30140-like [Tarenaya hassleriana]|uniref:GDSL esterase/lipase At4g30140-like n=1 Tax=Tarenaya hassleriana TaxID=28532 RepID=UPI00053C934D|nr:PREDICTED: GDSL esterase/lipase At4g30140-like [Tarenaya hassleriana]